MSGERKWEHDDYTFSVDPKTVKDGNDLEIEIGSTSKVYSFRITEVKDGNIVTVQSKTSDSDWDEFNGFRLPDIKKAWTALRDKKLEASSAPSTPESSPAVAKRRAVPSSAPAAATTQRVRTDDDLAALPSAAPTTPVTAAQASMLEAAELDTEFHDDNRAHVAGIKYNGKRFALNPKGNYFSEYEVGADAAVQYKTEQYSLDIPEYKALSEQLKHLHMTAEFKKELDSVQLVDAQLPAGIIAALFENSHFALNLETGLITQFSIQGQTLIFEDEALDASDTMVQGLTAKMQALHKEALAVKAAAAAGKEEAADDDDSVEAADGAVALLGQPGGPVIHPNIQSIVNVDEGAGVPTNIKGQYKFAKMTLENGLTAMFAGKSGERIFFVKDDHSTQISRDDLDWREEYLGSLNFWHEKLARENYVASAQEMHGDRTADLAGGSTGSSVPMGQSPLDSGSAASKATSPVATASPSTSTSGDTSSASSGDGSGSGTDNGGAPGKQTISPVASASPNPLASGNKLRGTTARYSMDGRHKPDTTTLRGWLSGNFGKHGQLVAATKVAAWKAAFAASQRIANGSSDNETTDWALLEGTQYKTDVVKADGKNTTLVWSPLAVFFKHPLYHLGMAVKGLVGIAVGGTLRAFFQPFFTVVRELTRMHVRNKLFVEWFKQQKERPLIAKRDDADETRAKALGRWMARLAVNLGMAVTLVVHTAWRILWTAARTLFAPIEGFVLGAVMAVQANTSERIAAGWVNGSADERKDARMGRGLIGALKSIVKAARWQDADGNTHEQHEDKDARASIVDEATLHIASGRFAVKHTDVKPIHAWAEYFNGFALGVTLPGLVALAVVTALVLSMTGVITVPFIASGAAWLVGQLGMTTAALGAQLAAVIPAAGAIAWVGTYVAEAAVFVAAEALALLGTVLDVVNGFFLNPHGSEYVTERVTPTDARMETMTELTRVVVDPAQVKGSDGTAYKRFDADELDSGRESFALVTQAKNAWNTLPCSLAAQARGGNEGMSRSLIEAGS